MECEHQQEGLFCKSATGSSDVKADWRGNQVGGAKDSEMKDTAVTELWQHITQAEEAADISLSDVTVQNG